MTGQDAIGEEQEALDAAHVRRLEIQAELERRLTGSAEDDSVAAAAMRSTRARLHELAQAEQGLVFGRLDSRDGDVLRVGRVGVPSADDDADPLVVDWRAEASRPFYTATAVAPQGQSRRRHIRSEGSTVVGVDDELLDGSTDGDLVGEGALLAALDERRTGRMGTAVATQAKGLEWDAALVVDPDGIVAEPRGWNGLYVALTRCTQELGRVEIA